MANKSSVHFILKGKSDYKDLAPVFPEILRSALVIADQVPEEEELTMIIQLNLDDLEKNRKPEGYIRKARIRMVFPLDRKEFYLQSYNPKIVDLGKIRETVSEILTRGGVGFDVTEDDDILFDLPSKKN
ncbi:hypothetical protein [Methanomethylophilus alvi]|jgi:hypothetical protein|uniref:hypothetical protein n=1 Tax=Methanomethylophilus alvi TaxID=1291540 RepID=UPI00033F969B|nr:hypothetical protein [Methanomethylophilus alvi]MDD7481032.1 hypothetical protein [Methanomethylophilus alvi]MDY7060977.1 hypothetical protein [Methanomethylophilus alvi]CDF30554.1 putative uncharacterized protein [Methanoculleus sp. CAG:1088]